MHRLVLALVAAAVLSVSGPLEWRTRTASAADKDPGSDCCFYTVSGSIWYDQNGNGFNNAEPPLAGWTIQVCDTNNVVYATTTTDALGQYSFNPMTGCGVTLRIKQVVQSGWVQTFPGGNGYHQVFATGCGNNYGPFNFGNNTLACPPFSKTYTLDADFNLGTLNGVITNSDQIELSPTPTTWPYAWIANAGEGSLSKVDTQTGREVARYYTGPPDGGNGYGYLAPSRTVIDKDGNCWVSNRTFGSFLPSMTQIVTSGGIDRNNNSVIDTSQDLNNNGMIDPAEILPWGQDERVIRHYALGSTQNNGARGTVLDKTGFIWVGLTSTGEILKINPNLSTTTYSPTNTPTVAPALVTLTMPGSMFAYGMALSPNGLIYISTLGPKAVQLDPGVASGGTGAGPAFTEFINHGGANYGIAVDQDCIVWLAMASHAVTGAGVVRWDPPLTLGNPLNGWTYNTGTVPPGSGRGICVDFNGDIWMGLNDGTDSIVKFGPGINPPILGIYPTGVPTPCGVGVASDGNIIVTPNGGSNWEKRNVITGANIPLVGPQLAGLGPYTYSDFTGSQQAMNGLQQGTWTVTTDGGYPAIVWNFIGWNDLVPALTSVQVEYRTAATIPGLLSQSWITQGAPGSILSPGRYIETRVRLQRTPEGCGQPFVTPVLYDLTVSAICDSCSFAQCPADTVIQCMSPQGAEFSYPTPILNGLCDSTYVVTCTPPSPTFLPMGTTQIQCIAVNAQDDTVFCSFNVTVAGNCDPPATGACCRNNFCSVMTEAQCLLQGGIYFGDNTDCVGGCDKNCAVPPNNLMAWWPLNGATSNVTPNLAGPLTGGTLVNAPTLVTGQQVTNSYSFNAAAGQYINVPHHATLNLGSSDFTVDYWIRTTSTNGVAPVVDKRDPNPLRGFTAFLFNGYPALQLAVASGFDNYILTAANGGAAAFVADGQWHLVAVTVDRDNPSGVRFYVDGVPVGAPFNPTNRQGNLNSSVSLKIAAREPALGGGTLNGTLDEIEITRRVLSSEEVQKLWVANASGKCPEACYVTQNVPCCKGLNASSSITICNYSLVPQTYSWGASAINGGPGCGPQGPMSIAPAAGTLTVPAQGCVTIPIQVACPSNVPIGTVSCYQVTFFNHNTGRIFGCQGSVKRAGKWCVIADVAEPVGIIPVLTGVARPVKLDVENLGESPAPEALNYTITALAGDTDRPSTGVRLNGLPPGEPVLGTLDLRGGQQGEIAFDVFYEDPAIIGYDRLVVTADTGTGLLEEVGEVAVRSVVSGLSGVPVDPGIDPGAVDGRLMLEVPNPFSASDRIRFRVDGDKAQEVKLRLYDLQGRMTKTFYYERQLPPGEYTLEWNARDDRGQRLPSGIYFLKLEVGKRAESMKMLVRN